MVQLEIGQLCVASLLIPSHFLLTVITTKYMYVLPIGVELLLRHTHIPLGRSKAEILAPDNHRNGSQENDR